MAYIELHNLVKRYNGKLAVDNLSLEIEQGEAYALLGPNGAGKSTTIKILLGLLKADSGDVRVAGLDQRKHAVEVKGMIGLVPQEVALYSNFTARENVEFFGSLYGLRGKELHERAGEALKFTGLSEHQKETPAKFSGGMKRRLNIACALVHRPRVMVMDEPTVGIDPQSRSHIMEAVQELNRQGATVIYTTHYMEEAEALCSRIGIIDHGKLIACGTKAELKNMVAAVEKLVVETAGINFTAVEGIKGLKHVQSVNLQGDRLEIALRNTQECLPDILYLLVRQGIRMKSIQVAEPDLESLFLTLTGRTLRD